MCVNVNLLEKCGLVRVRISYLTHDKNGKMS
jgi:hypothetical protein